MSDMDLMITLPSTRFPFLEMKPVRPQLEMSFWKMWVDCGFMVYPRLMASRRSASAVIGCLSLRGEEVVSDLLGEVDEAEIRQQQVFLEGGHIHLFPDQAGQDSGPVHVPHQHGANQAVVLQHDLAIPVVLDVLEGMDFVLTGILRIGHPHG